MVTTSKTTLAMMTAAVAMGLLAMGCGDGSLEAPSEVPAADLDALEGQQLITSVNADGTWTANALAPVIEEAPPSFLVEGTTIFTGPAGKTRKMGTCLLRRKGTGQNCTTATTCGTPPTGGSYYCTSPNGAGQKQCYYRPGAPSIWCAGTPAITGNPPVAPGSYTSLPQLAPSGSYWLTYGCFEACMATDPSSSSLGVAL